MTAKDLVLRSHDRHFNEFNECMVRLRDQLSLSTRECEELLAVINHELPGEGNSIAHWLRRCLCESIDIISCEDVLASFPDAMETARINDDVIDAGE